MIRQLANVEEVMNGPRDIPLSQMYHYKVFIKKTLQCKLLPWKRPTRSELRHVYNLLLHHFASTTSSNEEFLRERVQIKKTWPKMCEIMRACPGLVQFMKEYGAHSRFFYPFLLDIPRGVAMLPAYFMGRDIFGEIKPIPPSDAMYQFCIHDRVFQSVRFRTDYEKMFLKKAQNALILGAGTLPQLHYNNYVAEVKGQKITAYDHDVGLKDCIWQIFGGNPTDQGITYHFESFEEAFSNEEEWGKYQLVSAAGLASYYLKDLDHLLGGMKQCLAPDGIIILDLQLSDLAFIFDLLVLNWRTKPMMKLCKDVDSAVDLVKVSCEHLGLSIDEYRVEPNGVAGIVFKISKR